MIGCLRTRVRKQPIIAIYFESENVLKFYKFEAWTVSEILSFFMKWTGWGMPWHTLGGFSISVIECVLS